MPRLIAPNGSTVNVSDDLAAALVGQGYRAADGQPKRRTAKKAAVAKSNEK